MCFLSSVLIVLTASIQSSGQSSGLTPAIDRGVLSIRGSGGAALSNMRLRLRFNPNSSVAGRLELSGKEAGNDASGNYERFRYRFQPDPAFRAATSFSATLEIQNYRQPELVVASLIYSGPPLAARDGIQLLMGLDRFGRGMATKRMKLYWTSPAFISDYRLLGPANQLLLWQQIDSDDYHLLIPLAGDGFISEVGVSEIEYRPEFRVASSSYDPSFSPGRVPLFAYSTAKDPYQLARDSYELAFNATHQYGRLRWQKSYPEIFESFGWCSWNAYGHEVSQEKILNSVRSLRDKQIPLGFVLVDDGWLSTKDQKLVAFSADSKKFPGDLAALASTLRSQFHIPHVLYCWAKGGSLRTLGTYMEVGTQEPVRRTAPTRAPLILCSGPPRRSSNRLSWPASSCKPAPSSLPKECPIRSPSIGEDRFWHSRLRNSRPPP